MNKGKQAGIRIISACIVTTLIIGLLFATPVIASPNSGGGDVSAYAITQTDVRGNDAPDVSLYFDEKAKAEERISADTGIISPGNIRDIAGSGQVNAIGETGENIPPAVRAYGVVGKIKNYGGSGQDHFSSVIQAFGGGYVAVGYSWSSSGAGSDLPGNNGVGQYDMVIAKFDENGNKVWMKNYGRSSSDFFYSVTQAPGGGYVAVGYSELSAGAGSDLPGNKGGVIAKFDENGNKVWMKSYGGGAEDRFRSVTQAPGGGYVAVGHSCSSSGTGSDLPGNKGGYDMVIAKFDKNGNKVWMRNFGGINNDYLMSVTQAVGGGYVAVGKSSSPSGTGSDLSGNKGRTDMIIAKFDENGNKVWMKNYGGSDYDDFYSVTQAPGGGYVAVGDSMSSSGTGSDLLGNKGWTDMVIAKFDVNGNKVWIKNYGGSNYDWLSSVTPAVGGGYVVVGYSRSSSGTRSDLPGNKGREDMVIAKFDASGKKVWLKNYGGSGTDYFESVVQASGGGYVVVGRSSSSSGTGSDLLGNKGYHDMVIAKFDDIGVVIPMSGAKFRVSFSPNWGKLKIVRSYKLKWASKFSPKPGVLNAVYGKTYGKIPGIKKQPKGYGFAGWWTSASGGVQITSKSKVAISRDTTLYAHWKAKKYKVKFKAGSKTVSRKYAFGEKYSKLPKCKDKSGKFKFLGWYTKASGGKKVTVKSTVKITKTTTFYAHWKRK